MSLQGSHVMLIIKNDHSTDRNSPVNVAAAFAADAAAAAAFVRRVIVHYLPIRFAYL